MTATTISLRQPELTLECYDCGATFANQALFNDRRWHRPPCR